MHIVKTGFRKKDLDKVENICLDHSRNKKGNCLDKRKNNDTINNLYYLNDVFLNYFPPKKIQSIINKILGENYYSTLQR